MPLLDVYRLLRDVFPCARAAHTQLASGNECLSCVLWVQIVGDDGSRAMLGVDIGPSSWGASDEDVALNSGREAPEKCIIDMLA